MNDRPTAIELLAAARGFLETELVSALSDPRLKFQTLIVANVLAIVERELGSEEQQLNAEYAECCSALGLKPQPFVALGELKELVADANRQLCERIRAGKYDEAPSFRKLSTLLEASVKRKLEVANPKYLASF
jgi:hypothetical protein